MRLVRPTDLSKVILAALLPIAACSASSSDPPASASGGRNSGGSGASSNAGSTNSGGAPNLPGAGSSSFSGGAGTFAASGSGGSLGASGGNAGGSSAGMSNVGGSVQGGSGPVDPGPCKPRPVVDAADEVFYCSGVAQWEIYDKSVYTQYKANFDEIIQLLDQGYVAISRRMGVAVPDLPIRVQITKDTCCGGFAWSEGVGYNDGDFKDAGGMDWIRGVVLGEVVNLTTGVVTDNWPSDWWVDSVWYFPGFMAVDVLREVSGPARATKWETDEKYPTYPIYNLFLALKNEKDWGFYQKFFATITKDKIGWQNIGANPSAIKTNYVIAYMSLAYGSDLGDRFVATKKAPGADTAIIQAILDAHAKLLAADGQGKNTAGNWDKFRNGDYSGAASGL